MSGPSEAQRAPRISALEWLVAAVGLLLVAGTVAVMLVEAGRADRGPPRLLVRTDSVSALGGAGHLVHFTVVNGGPATAADVSILGELRDAAGVETGRARVDYVPGHSARRGGLLFRRDPRQAVVRLWAEGYREP